MPTRTPTRIGLTGLALMAAMSGLALVSAGSANAQVYEWSPQKTATRITGTLTFLPPDDHGAQFQCKVVLNFRTGNVKRGADALPEILSATIKGRGCESVHFTDLPWTVGPNAPNEGSLSQYGWTSATSHCDNINGIYFQALSSGTWNIGGDGEICLTGTLTSTPPVSIIPQP